MYHVISYPQGAASPGPAPAPQVDPAKKNILLNNIKVNDKSE